MTPGEAAEVAAGIPDLASTVDAVLSPLSTDVELAYVQWSAES